MSRRRIVVAGVALALAGAGAVFGWAGWSTRASDLRAGTNLKSFFIALLTYTEDDYYPALSSEPGRLMFDPAALYPEYLSNLSLLMSPADPVTRQIESGSLTRAFVFEHCSYFYLGYKVWDDETVEAFANAYRKRIEEGMGFESDLAVDLPIERLTRLDGAFRRHGYLTYEEIEEPKWEFLRPPESEIPVLIERPHAYPGPLGLWLGLPIPLSRPVKGGMVLYQAGNVEFIRYPGKWPMTERTISTLTALSSRN